ncbi:hypothetical protein Cfor_01173 [Coptotermes formosanus]|uniref:Uncharacterized protein n=1 Tax=Coptotermes formosanus TaxID=36987 RepID=A0A6L2PRJ2_COPFO|nr:hypothetical protein Cfor_01173 [Coptotermes formosanus]
MRFVSWVQDSEFYGNRITDHRCQKEFVELRNLSEYTEPPLSSASYSTTCINRDWTKNCTNFNQVGIFLLAGTETGPRTTNTTVSSVSVTTSHAGDMVGYRAQDQTMGHVSVEHVYANGDGQVKLSCPGQQCEKYQSLVACKVFGTALLSKEECDVDTSITTVEVDHIADPEEVKNDTQLRVCSFPDDQGCTFIFRYLIGNSTVEVQRTKQCGSDVNILALVLGVIGGIVLIGLLLLLVWKVVTSIHDRREYAKFEKERAMSDWNRVSIIYVYKLQ